MTPKEKAGQLTEKYYKYTPYWDCRHDEPDNNDYHVRCALEEVKGIIEFGNSLGLREELMYWSSVKKELNKMLKNMKINGIEQVNIGTEEEPYWIPKDNPFPIEKMKERQKEVIKEATDYVFREMPLAKAKKGDKSDVIVVKQTDTTLSFKINDSFLTGREGFLNMLREDDAWALRLAPVIFNGVALDKEQTKQFWVTVEKWLN